MSCRHRGRTTFRMHPFASLTLLITKNKVPPNRKWDLYLEAYGITPASASDPMATETLAGMWKSATNFSIRKNRLSSSLVSKS